MFLFNWIFDVLSWLGLYYKNAKILFLGLDNAGKTTLLHMLKDNRLAVHKPTSQPTMEELIMGSIKFQAFDLGGHKEVRRLWKEYSVDASAIIYIVDAADRDRLAEAQRELAGLLDELKSIPVLILGNKIDIAGAVSEDELRSALNIVSTTGKGTVEVREGERPIEVFMCSIANRAGYAEGFRWLSQYL